MSIDSEWRRDNKGLTRTEYRAKYMSHSAYAPKTDYGKIHIVIGDTQIKPGVRTDHLGWIGQYIVDHFSKFPSTSVRVIHLGDNWDMPSLSSYDKGKKSMEGRRCAADIDAGNAGHARLCAAMEAGTWRPDCHILRGNHEDRITRAIENDAQLDGLLSLDSLNTRGWTVHDYLKPVVLDGVSYAHYFYNPGTGKAYGGEVAGRLKTIGHSFTQGHQQGLSYAIRAVGDRRQHGLVLGSTYLHDEKYLGPQVQSYWRGIVVCHQVENGMYDPSFVSLDYLCRRYEGVTLERFLR